MFRTWLENRKSPFHIDVNHQNGNRAHLSLSVAALPVSQIVGYSRCEPLCCRSHETNIFLQASRRGNSFSKTRVVWRSRQSLFRRLQIPTDFTEIVDQIELQREPVFSSKHRAPFAPTTRAFTHTHSRSLSSSFSLVTDPVFDNKIGPRRAPAFLCLSLYPFASSPEPTLPFGIQSVWYVFPMNNIGGVAKSCRLHDHDSNNRTRTLRYRGLLILLY